MQAALRRKDGPSGREFIDERNKADSLIYQVEKMLTENADKLTETDRAPLESAVAKVKQVMNSEDLSALRRAVEELQQASGAMAQHIQSRQPVGAGAAAGGGGRGGNGSSGANGGHDGHHPDEVIDADFEVKK